LAPGWEVSPRRKPSRPFRKGHRVRPRRAARRARAAPRHAAGARDDGKRDVLYQGIAARAFERRFQLADHVVVSGARSENGLLHIDLVREVPEAQKPRTIAINGGKTTNAVTAPNAQAA
jgi:hypothetical protein